MYNTSALIEKLTNEILDTFIFKVVPLHLRVLNGDFTGKDFELQSLFLFFHMLSTRLIPKDNPCDNPRALYFKELPDIIKDFNSTDNLVELSKIVDLSTLKFRQRYSDPVKIHSPLKLYKQLYALNKRRPS